MEATAHGGPKAKRTRDVHADAPPWQMHAMPPRTDTDVWDLARMKQNPRPVDVSAD